MAGGSQRYSKELPLGLLPDCPLVADNMREREDGGFGDDDDDDDEEKTGNV